MSARGKTLLLTSSVLTDRAIIHSRMLDRLSDNGGVEVWAKSFDNPDHRSMWENTPAAVAGTPEVRPFREWFQTIRFLNDFLWDFHLGKYCRGSMWRNFPLEGNAKVIKPVRLAARLLQPLGLERTMEWFVQDLATGFRNSDEARDRLRQHRPEVICSAGPFQMTDPGIMIEAKRLGIPTVAYIPSWDNLSTKRRLLLDFDAYIVWSDWQRREFQRYYPNHAHKPVYVVGAPQFDVFYDPRFAQTREEYCRENGLDPTKKIVLYAIGSPNFFRGEAEGAKQFAKAINDGGYDDEDFQVVFRPHPLHTKGELENALKLERRNYVIQRPVGKDLESARSQDESRIRDWVNTFRHADLCIQIFSTVAIDAAICDTPVINLEWDPAEGRPQQQLAWELNNFWEHFSPIAKSGGLIRVREPEELPDAVRTCLRNPDLQREGREWISRRVCEFLDGDCGERFADALLDVRRRFEGGGSVAE